jgi:hypothetical protein
VGLGVVDCLIVETDLMWQLIMNHLEQLKGDLRAGQEEARAREEQISIIISIGLEKRGAGHGGFRSVISVN